MILVMQTAFSVLCCCFFCFFLYLAFSKIFFLNYVEYVDISFRGTLQIWKQHIWEIEVTQQFGTHGLSVYSKSHLQPKTQLFSGYVVTVYMHEPTMLIGMAGVEWKEWFEEHYYLQNRIAVITNKSVTAHPAWMIWFNNCEA